MSAGVPPLHIDRDIIPRLHMLFFMEGLQALHKKQSNGSREVTSLAESRDRVSGVCSNDRIA